jgi:hypothetical protein
MRRRAAGAVVAAVVVLGGLFAWRGWYSADERAIREALASLTEEFNASTSDGLGTAARAARLGTYFSDDVVVDLGPSTRPIEGRQAIVGMAARLQPRTAAMYVELADIGVTKSAEDPDAMDVTLTVSFIRQNGGREEERVDAREFALLMRKDGGRWQIARALAIDTLR